MSKGYGLQDVAEGFTAAIVTGEGAVAESSPVWSDDLGGPAAVCEITVTLDSGQRYAVTIKELAADADAISYNPEDAIRSDH